MSTRATAITPQVLVWARERAGLAIGDVAARMKKSEEEIRSWESGESAPTYNQLEDLAESVYHRPVALFFLPTPPEEAPPRQEFRTLPDFDIETLSPDTRYAIRLGHAYQRSLRELTGGRNPAARQLHRDLRPRATDTPVRLAERLREYLRTPLAEQQRWSSSDEAMGHWRDAIEQVGIFVFKRSFKQREVSGFCLTDDEFPVILINNSTRYNRQIFTLFHEVAHIIYGFSSITTEDSAFLERLNRRARALEVACNRLAAEFLVPSDSFPWERFDPDSVEESVADIAKLYNVSREVILRRLLDRHRVEQDTYAAYAAKWNVEPDPRSRGSGGNYYATQTAYFGRNFLRLAFSRYRAGLLPIEELAEHLGVKAKNLGKLEERVFAGG